MPDLARPSAPRGRRLLGNLLGILLATGVAVGLLLYARTPSEVEVVGRPPGTVTAVSPGVMSEHTIQLRCMTPRQAAELIRPLLGHPANTIEIATREGSRTLNVFATPEQMERVRSALGFQDAPGSASCAVAAPVPHP